MRLWQAAHQRARHLDSTRPHTEPSRTITSPAAIVAAYDAEAWKRVELISDILLMVSAGDIAG
jgi:hypothetical protein